MSAFMDVCAGLVLLLVGVWCLREWHKDDPGE